MRSIIQCHFHFRVNACVDVVVSGVSLLKALGLSPQPEGDHLVLNTQEELAETFQHYMQRGAAAERFYSDADSFQHISRTASQEPGAKVTTSLYTVCMNRLEIKRTFIVEEQASSCIVTAYHSSGTMQILKQAILHSLYSVMSKESLLTFPLKQ